MKGRLRYYRKLVSRVTGFIFTAMATILTFWSWDEFGITQNCWKLWILVGVVPLSAILAWIILRFTNKRTIWRQGDDAITLRYDDLQRIAFPKDKKEKAQNRIVLISMNTHFDTLISNSVVSATSVQGKWIGWMKKAGIEPDELNRQIQEAAAEQKILPVRTDQKEGNKEAYTRGTIIELDYKSTRFFLLALSEFDENLNAQTDREQIIDVIKKICDYYDVHGCGQPMYTPLIGTELSRAGLSEHESIMIMKSIFQLYSEKIHNELSIVVYKKHRNQTSIFE
jgi:hypothetical protein